METMRAAVFVAKDRIELREVPRPRPGPGEALLKVSLTTICGTDVHILRGEYPVKPGLIVGHEPVGRIEALGAGVAGFDVGARVVVGAITPLRAMPRRSSSSGPASRPRQGSCRASRITW